MADSHPPNRWPTTLQINAWSGEAPLVSEVQEARVRAWALRADLKGRESTLRPPDPADFADWQDDRVGWGVVAADRPELDARTKAEAEDLPEPIRRLIKERGDAPVFRYVADSEAPFGVLRNYATGKDVNIAGSPYGLAEDALPYYLLIVGSPRDVPWKLQYVLNAAYAVGRLDLEEEALDRYVTELIAGWEVSASQTDHAIVWAVDHGGSDITRLMRKAVAVPVAEALAGDADLRGKVAFIDGGWKDADHRSLQEALRAHRPGLVVTTSHGQTGPLGNHAAMHETLGLPVDHDHEVLDPVDLLANWQPDGAIWYAHACCSAGGDAFSIYSGLIDDSGIELVLRAVADLGARTAPLPTRLLSAEKPLRAFIGQVEPTFDWTIRYPLTGQYLTAPIREALYNNLYQPHPVGYCFKSHYAKMGALAAKHTSYADDYNDGVIDGTELLYTQLAFLDIQSMVILGDPTAVLPPLR